MSKNLITFKEVFDELGGVSGLVKITGANTKAVGAWQTHKRFPWWTYPLITNALAYREKSSSGDIWGLKGKGKVA